MSKRSPENAYDPNDHTIEGTIKRVKAKLESGEMKYPGPVELTNEQQLRIQQMIDSINSPSQRISDEELASVRETQHLSVEELLARVIASSNKS